MDFPGTAAVLSNIKAAVPYALDKEVIYKLVEELQNMQTNISEANYVTIA